MVAKPPEKSGFTLVELLVVIAILAILVGLLLPAVQKVRAASARAKCQSNLKQLVMAAHSYHGAEQAFPVLAKTPTTNPVRLGYKSPLLPLLPYLEQQPLYDAFVALVAPNVGTSSYTLGFGSPSQVAVYDSPSAPAATVPKVLLCPADNILPNPITYKPISTLNYYGVTSYRVNASTKAGVCCSQWNEGVIISPSLSSAKDAVRLADITDGASNTIMFGEFYNSDPQWDPAVVGSFYTSKPLPYYMNSVWAMSGQGSGAIPGNGSYQLNERIAVPPGTLGTGTSVPAAYITPRSFAYGSGHPGGANFALSDGSVRFVADSINYTSGLLAKLCTRRLDEIASIPD